MEIIPFTDYNDFIHIDLNVIYACNMKCSYCYARKEEPWNTMMKKDILELSLRRIRGINKPMHINLLGGEPSMYPSLKYLLEELEKNDNVKLIKIYTNGIKDLRKYKSAKVKLVYTTHGKEAQSRTNLQYILDKVEKDDYITIMLEDDPELLEFYEKVKDYPLVEGNYIQYNDVPDFRGHPLSFLQNICKVDGKTVNQIQYNDVHTKGLKCHMNYFSVNYDGEVTNCLQRGHIKDFDFNDVYLDCPYEFCKQTCYMYQRKYDI